MRATLRAAGKKYKDESGEQWEGGSKQELLGKLLQYFVFHRRFSKSDQGHQQQHPHALLSVVLPPVIICSFYRWKNCSSFEGFSLVSADLFNYDTVLYSAASYCTHAACSVMQTIFVLCVNANALHLATLLWETPHTTSAFFEQPWVRLQQGQIIQIKQLQWQHRLINYSESMLL